MCKACNMRYAHERLSVIAIITLTASSCLSECHPMKHVWQRLSACAHMLQEHQQLYSNLCFRKSIPFPSGQ